MHPNPFETWPVLCSGLCNTSHVALGRTVLYDSWKKRPYHGNVVYVPTSCCPRPLQHGARCPCCNPKLSSPTRIKRLTLPHPLQHWKCCNPRLSSTRTRVTCLMLPPSFATFKMLQSQAELPHGHASHASRCPVLCNIARVAMATWAMLQILTELPQGHVSRA